MKIFNLENFYYIKYIVLIRIYNKYFIYYKKIKILLCILTLNN